MSRTQQIRPAARHHDKYMLRLLCGSLLALPLSAGVIQGIVIEQSSGLPLARTSLQVERIEGAQRLSLLTVRAGSTGNFVVHGLPTGQYVLTAVRGGFAPETFRATPGDSRSAVLNLKEDSEIFATVRMRRLGAITGRILDENRVGMAGVTVIAYEGRLPLRSAAQAKSDDRGVYRIHGLHAGKYYVRTAPAQLDDGLGVLPTFFPFGVGLSTARTVPAGYDSESPEVDIQPAHGRLFSVIVTPLCPPGAGATVVLVSDTGRREAKVPCGDPYTFAELAPTDYEILAYVGQGDRFGTAGYERRRFEKEESVSIQLNALPRIQLSIDPHGAATTVFGRRRDLAGVFERIGFTNDRSTPVLPGSWEVAARADSAHYISELRSWGSDRYPDARSPEWTTVFAWRDHTQIELKVGDRPASLAGVITSKGEPAVSAPVYLYPASPETMQLMNGYRKVFAGADGSYRFDGLNPGRYYLASSFDVIEVNEDTMATAKAVSIELGPGSSEHRELTLWEPE
jgi:hypothetical protein